MHKDTLSAVERDAVFKKMAAEAYDLFIIGGGITGAGIALDASLRGLKVAMADKQDFAAGTSSRSTKLIHGGLRYLKQLELALVREVGKERTIIYRNAMHLVSPVHMLVPVLENGTYSKPALRIGLWLYDMLASVKKEERHRILSSREAMLQEPLLDERLVKGAGIYTEYQTDDARLTIEVIKTACSKGADCINYAGVSRLIYTDGKVSGVVLRDELTGKDHTIHASKVVNAAGPWVDEVRVKDAPLSGKTLHHTKGVHLVVPFNRLPLRQSVYFDAFDKRLVFAIPRNGCTYIGTTDTNYKGDLEHPHVTNEDAVYLLNAVNMVFPKAQLQKNDIISCRAGIRPLIHEEGKSPSEISRKDEVFVSASGLISIAGGKLTGYRKMAEKVVDMVVQSMTDKKFVSLSTADTKLSGGEFSSVDEFERYRDAMIEEAGSSYDRKEITRLVNTYGSNTEIILRRVKELPAHDTARLLKAELWYAVNYEAVNFPGDFLVRRTSRMLFDQGTALSALPVILEELTNVFGWSESERDKCIRLFQDEKKSMSVWPG
jgi:glycerol-3-phosphate dehydrogenase